MSVSLPYHRPLGKTGLSVPPIFFRGDVMDNSVPLPDQTKRVICGEWLKHVAPPVAIAVRSDDFRSGSLLMLGNTLRHFEVPPDEVLINFEFDLAPGTPAIPYAHEFYLHFDDARHVLGAPFAPALVTLRVATCGIDVKNSSAKLEVRHIREVLNRWATQYGSSHDVALGLAFDMGSNIDFTTNVAEVDYAHVLRGPNILERSNEQVEQIKRRAEQGIGVITSGVFAGGFLLGGADCSSHKYTPNDPIDQSRLAWRKAFISLCHGHGVRPAHACIQYALTIPGGTAVSVSTSQPDRVAENALYATTPVPTSLWASMLEEGLLESQSHVLK